MDPRESVQLPRWAVEKIDYLEELIKSKDILIEQLNTQLVSEKAKYSKQFIITLPDSFNSTPS